jgi:hypothetical protein
VNRILGKRNKAHRSFKQLKKFDAFYEDGFGKMKKAMVFECFDQDEAQEKAIRFATLIKCKFSHVIRSNEK